MGTAQKKTSVVTIRIGEELERALDREARRRRTSKSEVARELLAAGLGDESLADPVAEARRQSLRVSRRSSEEETLDFLEQAADTRGWE